MSLKAFHLVFIAASTLLAFGFGVWSLLRFFSPSGRRSELIRGSLSLSTGIALIVYGRYVFRKLKNVSYL
jgi:flagellar biogenesis protein FliO